MTSGATRGTDPSEGVGPQTDSVADSTTLTGIGPRSTGSTSEAFSDGGPELAGLLWVTAPVMGDWDNADGDRCGAALGPTGAICVNTPIVIAGREQTPIAELPGRFEFLDGPFYAATTGQLVLESLDDLVDGIVEAEFVEALSTTDLAAELYVWRGPLVLPGDANCEDWSTPKGNGTLFLFQAGSSAVATASRAPCVSSVRLLCSCAGIP